MCLNGHFFVLIKTIERSLADSERMPVSRIMGDRKTLINRKTIRIMNTAVLNDEH